MFEVHIIYTYLTAHMMLLLISTLHNSTYIYTNHKISIIHVRTLKYSLEGCVFAMLAAFSFLLICLLFLFFCMTVNFDA